VTITLAGDGLLRGFEALGHAGPDPAGRNIACAAATMLLRTTGRLCESAGIAGEGGRGEPGEMRLVVSRGAVDDGWLRGVTDYFVRGMKDLQDEFPREIIVRVKMMEV